MKTKIYGLLLLLMTAGCGNRHSAYFSEFHEVIPQVKDSVVLQGELLLSADSALYIGSIHSVKGYLVAENSDNKDAVFAVYSEEGTLLNRFGHIGRAKNEFTAGMRINGQFEDGCFFVNDVNLSALKAVNLKASMDSSVCMVDKSLSTGGRVMNAYYINDSTILYEQETRDNYQISQMNTRTGHVAEKYDLYTPHTNAFDTYYSKMCIHSSKRRLASAMCFLNQVNFMDADGNQRKSASLYADTEICEDRQKRTAYYCDITSNDRHVYALYMNQLLEKDSYRTPKPMEVHVFDWEGNFQGKLVMPEYIVNITVNEDGTYLYGRNTDCDVFRYRMEGAFQ